MRWFTMVIIQIIGILESDIKSPDYFLTYLLLLDFDGLGPVVVHPVVLLVMSENPSSKV